jgi:hypothetical protein
LKMRFLRKRKREIEEYIDASMRGEKPNFWDIRSYGVRKDLLEAGAGKHGLYSGVTDLERGVVKDLDKLIEKELGPSQKKHEILQEARFRGDPDEEEKRDALHSKRRAVRKKMWDTMHRKYGRYDDDYSSKTPPDLFHH